MAKIGQNTIDVLNYLKENAGKKLTSQDVADALNMSTATVNGVFTALQNKKLGYREDATVTGAVDITFLGLTDEGKAAEVGELSENAQAIIAYLKTVDGQNITTDDAAEATGIEKRKFTGTFNSLVKKGIACRTAAKVEAQVPVKYLVLTDEGMAFDPIAANEAE